MKLQLFLENREVDLTGTEVFPLTKTYDNLFNPTNIIVEYSKAINIPISSKNNEILGLSYRLDREIASSDSTNLGLYLDPNKRIPMKLIYNNEVILDGYAKFVSSTSSQKNNYYTLNLFGILGEIFHKLKDVVVSEDKLKPEQKAEEDGGAKYILNDHSSYDGERVIFDASFIENSWQYADIDISETFPTQNYLYKTFGAVPSYSGFYPNFDPKKVLLNPNFDAPISDCLKDEWATTYCNLKGYNISNLTESEQEDLDNFLDSRSPSDLVGDGFMDYQMNDYRSHRQRPFIYFNKLLYMFKEKISELSDYKLELDKNWFNSNNPYWAKMCYVFDIIEKEGQDSPSLLASKSTIIDPEYFGNANGYNEASSLVTTTLSHSSTDNILVIEPSILMMDVNLNEYIDMEGENTTSIRLRSGTCIEVSLTAGNVNRKYYTAYTSYENFINIKPDDWEVFSEDQFLPLYPMMANTGIEGNYQNQPSRDELCMCINLPRLSFEGDFSTNKNVAIDVTIANKFGGSNVGTSFFEVADNNYKFIRSIDVSPDSVGDYQGRLRFVLSPLSVVTSWNNLPVGLDTFYKKEDPIFNIILEYTKMFGLYWTVDYANKTIKLQRRETLFEDYTVENWDKKLDRTQNMVIEPVAFPTKYINFNYEEVDGFRYSAYKEEYDVEYGDRIVQTGYDFNVDDTELFENLLPCISSNRNYISYKRWIEWDANNIITASPDLIPRIECADSDNASYVAAGRWCMRSANVNISEPTYITNDTSRMLEQGESYYIDYRSIDRGLFDTDFYVRTYVLPVFTPIYKDSNPCFDTFNTYYSALFNTPYVDYTTEGLFKKAQGNTIYDICWGNFINERYNAQNKKVTAYFDLSTLDYAKFRFNQFVILDNQLFMVNKINNFEPTNSKSTQCELIQVSDPSKYNIPAVKFPYIQYSILGSTFNNGRYDISASNSYGTFILNIRTSEDINLIINSHVNSDDNVYREGSEIMGDSTTTYSIYYDLVSSSYEFEIIVVTGEDRMEIPCRLIQS